MTKKEKNLSIKQKSEWWNKQIDEITYLVTVKNYRLKDLSKHFDCKVGTISSVLFKRKLSILNMRHQYNLQQKIT
jgi:hypothetical protein